MKIAVLIGGSGRTLKNLIDLGFEISLVISHDDVPGLKYAEEASIPYSVGIAGLWPLVDSHSIDLVVMAGWIKHIFIPDRWINRVMNIHPSLLPAFGGKGMYGKYVHEAVIEKGVKFSGCTVHYVDRVYDDGPIIIQKVVPVLPNDTAEELAARVFEQEKIAYPEAIRLHLENKIKVEGKKVVLM